MAKKLAKKDLLSITQRVLVIDDDVSLRMLLEIMLKKYYKVITVANGYEALFWLENNEIPDLIIVDINMPRIDGIKFINHLKKSGYYRNIPIIVLSGFYDGDIKKQCAEAGVGDFMIKPFNPSELSEKIADILSNQKNVKYA